MRTRVLIIAFFCSTALHAEIELTLKNTFIERYKNRATITATFTVDKAHKRPNPPKSDGDMHIAGRAPEIGLPIVAEIMNAHDTPGEVQRVHDVEGTDEALHVTGVWRLWCEHGGAAAQQQDAPLKRFTTTNPEHIFEIHPITSIDGKNLVATLQPVEAVANSSFEPKDADTAFQRYENLRSHIERGKNTTTITTSMAGFNYVEFQLRLNQDPVAIQDGYVALAQVEALNGDLLVHNRRMVFVKDSEPAKTVATRKRGDCLHVLGIPRINLALLSWRTHHAAKRPEVLDWNLPYEIVIVGAYNDACADDGEN